MCQIMLDGEHLTIEDTIAAAYAQPGELTVRLSAEAEGKVAHARRAVETFLADGRVVLASPPGLARSKTG